MGKFETHGGTFTPQGYIRVNEGGKHDDNPNGGVQLGTDQQGIPNMVEEDEVIYDDYVYSDNIRATEEMLAKNNLPTKYAGKLYSEIADILVDDPSIIPNDYVSNNGLNKMLLRLAQAQEEQKTIEAQAELEEELANMSPEELAQLEQMLSQEEAQQGQPTPEEMQLPPEQEMAAQQMTAPGMMQAPMPQMMAGGGPLRRFDDGGDTDDSQPRYLREMPFAVRDNTMTRLAHDNGMWYQGPLTEAQVANMHNRARQDNMIYSMMPLIGLPNLLGEIAMESSEGDYGGAALDAASAILPLLKPLKGVSAARKGLKLSSAATKGLGKARAAKATKLLDKIADLRDFLRYEHAGTAAYKKAATQLSKYEAEYTNLFSGIADAAVRNEGLNLLGSVGTEAVEGAKTATTTASVASDAAKTSEVASKTAKPSAMARFKDWKANTKTGRALNTAVGSVVDPAYYYARAAGRHGATTPWRFAAGTGGAAQMAGEIYAYNHLFPNTVSPLDYAGSYAIPVEYDVMDGLDKFNERLDSLATRYGDGGIVNRFDNGSALGLDLTLPTTKIIPNGFGQPLARQMRNAAGATITMPDFGYTKTIPGGTMTVNPYTGVRTTSYNPIPGISDVTIPDVEAGEVQSQPAPLSTALRYLGPATSGLLALYNAAQPADKYKVRRVRPRYATGDLQLIDPVYRPIDINQSVNTVLASGAGSARGLRNSGSGPSAGQLLVSLDNNLGRNVGSALSSGRQYNDTLLSNAIAGVNNNRSAKANFDTTLSGRNAEIFNTIAAKNSESDLKEQLLNSQAETAKYQAISSQIDQLAKGLSDIGRENFIMNQINSNQALLYRNGPDGWGYYKGNKKIS